MIIDSSALAAILMREKKAEQIIQIITEEKPYTLPLAIKETINAAWKRYTKNEITSQNVQKITEQLLNLINKKALQIIDQEQHITKATKIAIENKITIYDAIFIAAAQQTNNKLLTLDQKQAEIAEKLSIKTIKL